MGMNKDRYIELHGEEAWITENKRRKEYLKQYYQKHAQIIKDQAKEYHKKHREEIKEKRDRYYCENKEIFSEKGKEYRESHKEELSKYHKDYQNTHKEEISEYQRKYREKYLSTKEGYANSKLHQYRYSDAKQGRPGFSLTRKWIIDNILNSHCVYCGESNWKKLGCDRIDDNLPHTPENCVCSCWPCNNEKHYKRMSVEEFVRYKKSLL